MGWFTGCVLYALIWWIVLFAVLPFWSANDGTPDPVTGWRGAPAEPRMGRKVVVTTLVALVVWGGCVALIESPYVNFRHGILAIPEDR
jgi:predicted secreted protein